MITIVTDRDIMMHTVVITMGLLQEARVTMQVQGLSIDTVKNWTYGRRGMNALQLFLIMRHYDFVSKFVNEMIRNGGK